MAESRPRALASESRGAGKRRVDVRIAPVTTRSAECCLDLQRRANRRPYLEVTTVLEDDVAVIEVVEREVAQHRRVTLH